MSVKPRPFVESIRFETGDRLRVSRVGNAGLGSEVLMITQALDNDQMQRSAWTLPNLSIGSSATEYYDMQAGYLLDLSITPVLNTPDGQSYYQFSRISGRVDNPESRFNFFSGYAAAPGSLVYPITPAKPPNDCDPPVLSLDIASSGVGSEITFPNAANGEYEIISMSFRLVTSAAVANRMVNFNISDNKPIPYNIPGRTAILASSDRWINLAKYWQLPADNALAQYFPLPDLGYLTNPLLTTSITNLNAADAIDSASIRYKQRVYYTQLA